MADTFTEEQTPQTQEAPASTPEETQTPERRPRPERAQSAEGRSEEARSETDREARPRPERRPRRRVQREYAAPTLGEAFRGLPRVMRYYLTDPAGTSRRMAENREWLTGVLLMLLPLPSVFFAAALLLLGLGCAPIFPAMLHLTPERFGKEKSRDIMGFQMAFSYLGSTFAPPLFGLLASRTSMMLYPGFLAAAAALLALTTALTDRKIKPAAN